MEICHLNRVLRHLGCTFIGAFTILRFKILVTCNYGIFSSRDTILNLYEIRLLDIMQFFQKCV